MNAFQCVMTMARVSRDFVHSRTVKDVFPGLLKFLTSVKVTSVIIIMVIIIITRIKAA